MSAERARRHHEPRYKPVGGKRSLPLDPQRAERAHPSWCRCTRCGPPGPADRGGCGATLLAFASEFLLGAVAIAAGIGAVAWHGGRSALHMIGIPL